MGEQSRGDEPAFPEYNAVAICPKCQHDDIGTLYCEKRLPSCLYKSAADTRQHMHRHCRHCHCEWIESPLDADAQLARNEEKTNGKED